MLDDLAALMKRSAVVTAPAAVFIVPLVSVYLIGHGLGGGFWAAFTIWFALAALLTLGTIVLHQRESRQQ